MDIKIALFSKIQIKTWHNIHCQTKKKYKNKKDIDCKKQKKIEPDIYKKKKKTNKNRKSKEVKVNRRFQGIGYRQIIGCQNRYLQKIQRM